MIFHIPHTNIKIFYSGIRVGDVITKINDTFTDNLTLLEAQLEIQESGRHLKLFVKGFAWCFMQMNSELSYRFFILVMKTKTVTTKMFATSILSHVSEP